MYTSLGVITKGTVIEVNTLTHVRPMLNSYKNQSIDLQRKLVNLFLYDRNSDIIWVKWWRFQLTL